MVREGRLPCKKGRRRKQEERKRNRERRKRSCWTSDTAKKIGYGEDFWAVKSDKGCGKIGVGYVGC